MAQRQYLVIEYEVTKGGNALGPSGLVEDVLQWLASEKGAEIPIAYEHVVDLDLDEEKDAIKKVLDSHDKRFE